MEEKISKIIGMSEALAKIPAGAYHSPCREEPYNLCRLAANNLIMREIGIDYNTLSHYIKSRDRATLYMQYKNHKKQIGGWDTYRLFYTSLKAQFLSLSKAGGYLDRDKFDLILTRNGIPSNIGEDEEGVRTCITISIGNFEGRLYRNTRNVSTAIKKLIDAFDAYEYDMSFTKFKRYERVH